MTTAITNFTKALLVPFEISYLIAKSKEHHTIEKTLLLPAATKMCKIMHGENYSQAFPLSIIP
jgi:hypothetical protein